METFISSIVYLFSWYHHMERCVFCFYVNEEPARSLFCGAGVVTGAATAGVWVTISSLFPLHALNLFVVSLSLCFVLFCLFKCQKDRTEIISWNSEVSITEYMPVYLSVCFVSPVGCRLRRSVKTESTLPKALVLLSTGSIIFLNPL